MAKLRCLGADSSGNCFLLECDDGILILELGLPWRQIVRGLDYDLSRVTACLCTHSHQDHVRSADHATANGIAVFSCPDVAGKHKGVLVLPEGKKSRIGGFCVQPIPVSHSVQNYAYLIEHKDIGKMVFATDCADFPYRIKGVNHWCMEANYSDDIILDRMCDNQINRSLSETHLSIDKCTECLHRNFSADTQTIILTHLSAENSNEQEFVRRVKGELGFANVVAAYHGMDIELNITEF